LSPTPEHSIPPPKRTDAELAEVVRGRVTELRARRRARRRAAVIGGCTALAVLLVASIAVAANHGGHGSARVDTADDSTTTTTASSTTSPPDSYTLVLPSSTTSQPAGSTTEAPTTTDAPTTTTTLPACSWSQFVITVATEGARDFPNKALPPTYAPGDPVTIKMTLRNEGGACYGGDAPPFVLDPCLHARVEDADGHDVWDAPSVCSAVLHVGPVPSGYSSTATATWDQARCPQSDWDPSTQGCTQPLRVPAGTYTVTVPGDAPPRVTDTTIDLLAYVDPPVTPPN
jgi:hypothetical protein